MTLNPFTAEYLKFINDNKHTIRGKEYILNHVIFKKDAVIESMKHGNLGKRASPIQSDQMKRFVEDLDFIEQGLKGHWVDVFTFPGSQEYYHALQKEIEFLVSNLK